MNRLWKTSDSIAHVCYIHIIPMLICPYILSLYIDKPGPPNSVQVVEVHKRSVVLTWRPPTDDGGSPVTGYRAEYRFEGGFKWEWANEGEKVDGRKYTVTGLKEGTVYEFRVAAENKAGIGQFAECSMPVEVKESVGKYALFCHMGASTSL